MESDDTQNSRIDGAQRPLFAAALALVLGLGLTGTVSPTAGGALTLGSWIYFIYALHRYGRTGRESRAKKEPR